MAQKRVSVSLNRLGLTQECNGRTYGQTDIIVANATLNYFARPQISRIFFYCWQQRQ